MPASDIGIDIGTRNSLVYSTGKGIVLQEMCIRDRYKAWEETGFTEKEFERNPLNKLENIESTSIKEIFDSAKA